MASPVAWSPDGSHVLLSMAEAGGDPALWSVSLDGHQVLRLDGTGWCCGTPDLRIHPDGRRIAVVAGEDRGSIWVLEGGV